MLDKNRFFQFISLLHFYDILPTKRCSSCEILFLLMAMIWSRTLLALPTSRLLERWHALERKNKTPELSQGCRYLQLTLYSSPSSSRSYVMYILLLSLTSGKLQTACVLCPSELLPLSLLVVWQLPDPSKILHWSCLFVLERWGKPQL